ncbi:hypothetical protein [Pseudoxanthomonas sp. PXM01]|uniref:hypothetical protein n=1 Tax=Pseudoxanthomonas sp. PXM01 TaxID=2769295 RepID=UPI001780AFE9|nr:hypothetical protein [Pseudoxanthomonas sp. PXM01]MBD9468316.1 hypothetical protein [Pseudoxanthomonas sp. PXM01]
MSRKAGAAWPGRASFQNRKTAGRGWVFSSKMEQSIDSRLIYSIHVEDHAARLTTEGVPP